MKHHFLLLVTLFLLTLTALIGQDDEVVFIDDEKGSPLTIDGEKYHVKRYAREYTVITRNDSLGVVNENNNFVVALSNYDFIVVRSVEADSLLCSMRSEEL